MSDFTLDDLEAVIRERLATGDETSYTRKLAAKGMPKAAQKLGEEAVEAVIAAVSGDKAGLASETADLLYHLLVVLALADVKLEAVMAELAGRTGRSGLVEKAQRPKD
ncbi:phosphoribosyl-ATP diphosphatase [Chthonobacter rhizosphaerae]|uniref:phosphoribosyl-ATP diphosphatase n=1 Tax=Chthonobacter rhizosphaerae TaxID=2735553 RepID=UPI0015EE4B1D|nr:phosphoribosyl-ATP diphosphatase [Chthonobacter rhizosphaerae]